MRRAEKEKRKKKPSGLSLILFFLFIPFFLVQPLGGCQNLPSSILTPNEKFTGKNPNIISINEVKWKKYCYGRYKVPIAA